MPAGKNLYILSTYRAGGSTTILEVNGLRHSTMTTADFQTISAESPLLIKAGDLLSGNDLGSGATHINAFGYLADENYFANCGGGGSSTTTSSNSVGDFSYPDGKDNMTPIIHDLGSSIYTVPTGKNLYITSFSSNSVQDELKISSNSIFKGKGHWSTGQGAPVGHFELL